MSKKRKSRGFTLAETLIVVALITILSGVSFIAVQNHMRAMAQLERDGIAKEIFVAAQNHLTMVRHEGYLGLGKDEAENGEAEGDGVYYFVGSATAYNGTSLLKLMLPFGSVDETVRLGGSYIVRYEKETGRVLDVFFSWPSSHRFPYAFTGTNTELAGLLANYTGEGNTTRRHYGDTNAVIGWYGGEEAQKLETITLKQPLLEVKNAERLQVIVTDTNTSVSAASLQLIVKGVTSGSEKAIPLSSTSGSATITVGGDASQTIYTITMDDITKQGQHFAELFPGFIPGENITVQAVAYCNSKLSNIAYSGEKKTNSLFGDISTDEGSSAASVYNIRHLENLDEHISAVSNQTDSGTGTGKTLTVSEAVQHSDLSWADFKTAIGDSEKTTVYKTGSENNSGAGNFMPVSPLPPLAYDGDNHRISDVTVQIAGDAGIFGTLSDGSSVANLLIRDAVITSTSGNATSGSAGGLIGSMLGTTVENCAVVARVQGTAAAGGLVGTSGSGSKISTVTGCYASGHTNKGSYLEWVEEEENPYDVTGATVGGLIGSAGNTAISFSYSTCSVTGSTAVGGLIGSGSGKISNCYATGLVTGTGDAEDAAEGAFAGDYTGSSLENCKYYMIINERLEGEDGKKTFSFLEPIGGGTSSTGILALDRDAETYESFVGSDWKDAVPADPALVTYYQGMYPLPTVAQLGAEVEETDVVMKHYGDWPAPEIFVINEAAGGSSSGETADGESGSVGG